MALKNTISTPQGIEIPDAYHRVGSVHVIGKTQIIFKVYSMKDNKSPAFMDMDYSCSYLIDGDNPIKQAYGHLKTLPEFAGAVDC